MTYAPWSPSYETGHPEIDGQHRRLFELVNVLHGAMAHGQGKEALGPAIAALTAYASVHFAAEETLMERAGYPHLEEHRLLHAELSRQVDELALRYEKGFLTIPSTLSRFMADWLRHHIRQEDMRFVTWLRSRPSGG